MRDEVFIAAGLFGVAISIGSFLFGFSICHPSHRRKAIISGTISIGLTLALWWYQRHTRLQPSQFETATAEQAKQAKHADEQHEEILREIGQLKQMLARGAPHTQLQVDQLRRRIEDIQRRSVPLRGHLGPTKYETEQISLALLKKQISVSLAPTSKSGPEPTPSLAKTNPVRPCDGGLVAPVLLSRVEAEYSEEAWKAKYQGTVVLAFKINPNGHTEGFSVERSLGLGLDEKAIEAVRQWKFKPAIGSCGPTSFPSRAEVNFRLFRDPVSTKEKPSQAASDTPPVKQIEAPSSTAVEPPSAVESPSSDRVFAVCHEHSKIALITTGAGELTISRNHVTFTENGKHDFAVACSEVVEAARNSRATNRILYIPWKDDFHIKLKGGRNYNFVVTDKTDISTILEAIESCGKQPQVR